MGMGIAAAAMALGVTQLLAAPFGPAADARTAVGSAVIALTPGPLKEWAIQTFGTADKLFLSVAVVLVIAVIAAIAANAEAPRRPVGSIVIGLAGLAGAVAVLSRPGAALTDTIPVVIGTVCGIAVLRLLTSGRLTDGSTPTDDAGPDPGRRLSLATLGLLGAGLLSGVIGAVWSRRLNSVAGDRQAFTVPPATVPAPPIPPQVQPAGVDLPTFVTANDDFYRIDTALSVPQLSREDWRLRIHGMVDHEITYGFDDLRDFAVVEKVVTLTCVSNPVGGNLISNAMWTGYRVRDLLAAAGVHPDADMVLSTSIDGFTAGTPVQALTDSRDALLAITMNGQPLPDRTRLPRAAGGARVIRLCVGHQMGGRPGADPVRPRAGLLDRAGLVGARPDQNRVAHRRATQGRRRTRGSRDVRRGGLGAEPWRPRRRGPHRRRGLAAFGTRRELLGRYLAAVEFPVAGHLTRSAHHHGAGHRQHRCRADA